MSVIPLLFHDAATTAVYTLSLHDALPISASCRFVARWPAARRSREPLRRSHAGARAVARRRASRECEARPAVRSEEHTSELQSQFHLVCRLLLEKKKRIGVSPVHRSQA